MTYISEDSNRIIITLRWSIDEILMSWTHIAYEQELQNAPERTDGSYTRIFQRRGWSSSIRSTKYFWSHDGTCKGPEESYAQQCTEKKSTSHLYISAARGFTVDHSDVDAFTNSILAWWINHGSSTGAWREAAEIVFSMTPNSASAERVFSLLMCMFGDKQDNCLADLVQSSIMLRYNKREL